MSLALLICGIAAVLTAALVAARLPDSRKKETEMQDAAEFAPANNGARE